MRLKIYSLLIVFKKLNRWTFGRKQGRTFYTKERRTNMNFATRYVISIHLLDLYIASFSLGFLNILMNISLTIETTCQHSRNMFLANQKKNYNFFFVNMCIKRFIDTYMLQCNRNTNKTKVFQTKYNC